MALQQLIQISGKTVLQAEKVTLPAPDHTADFNAYIKVEQVLSTKTDAIALVTFKDGDYVFERSYTFTVNLDGDNVIKQAYLYLKTLPEFAEATDC